MKFAERNQRTLPPEITAVLKQAGFNDNAVMSGIPEAEVKGKIQKIAYSLNKIV